MLPVAASNRNPFREYTSRHRECEQKQSGTVRDSQGQAVGSSATLSHILTLTQSVRQAVNQSVSHTLCDSGSVPLVKQKKVGKY